MKAKASSGLLEADLRFLFFLLGGSTRGVSR